MTIQPTPETPTILVHRGTTVVHQSLEDTVIEIVNGLSAEPTPEPDPTPTPTPTPTVSNYEKIKLHAVAPEITIDLDAFSQHGVIAKTTVSISFVCPKALVDDVVSGQIEVRDNNPLTFTQSVKWLTEPRTTGPGILSVRRSYFGGTTIWRLFWAPERTA